MLAQQQQAALGRTIYVGNLPSQLAEEAVSAFFSTCGEVTQIRLAGDAFYATRFGFLEFSSPEGAQAALLMNGVDLDGKKIKVTLSKTPITPPNPMVGQQTFVNPLQTLGFMGHAQLHLPLANPYAQAQSIASATERIPLTVYITGVDSQLQEEHLTQFFGICGQVTNIRLCGDNSHPSKFAFIEFASREAAMTACGLSGVTLGSAALKVQPSKTAIQGARPSSLGSPAAALDPTYHERACKTVYIGSLDVNVPQTELLKLLSNYGSVNKLCLAGDTVHAARFAFAEFATVQEAQAALALNGTVVGDRPIRVTISKTPIYASPKNTVSTNDLQNLMIRQQQQEQQQLQMMEQMFSATSSGQANTNTNTNETNRDRDRDRDRGRKRDRDRDRESRSRSRDRDEERRRRKKDEERESKSRRSRSRDRDGDRKRRQEKERDEERRRRKRDEERESKSTRSRSRDRDEDRKRRKEKERNEEKERERDGESKHRSSRGGRRDSEQRRRDNNTRS